MLFNQIGQPRWNSPLVRFFGMKGGSPPAPTLAPEIAPSFDINQRDDPSLAYLRNEKLAGYGTTLSAAVGFYSTAALRNPANSGMLIEVQRVLAYSLNSTVTISLSTISDLTSAGACTPYDTRWGPLTTIFTAGRYTFRNDSAGPLSGQRLMQVPAGVTSMIELGTLLVANTALIIETAAVNQGLTFAFQFRERPIPAEELATG